MTVPLLVALLLASPILAPGSTSYPYGAYGGEAEELYREIDLAGTLERSVFSAGFRSAGEHGPTPRILAIADMSQPSTERRLYVFDLEAKRLVLRTWVAHGSNTGGLMAESFSNRDGSHQTSLGLYRVGSRIVSPKHGPALLHHGLDTGTNDNARARQVIIPRGGLCKCTVHSQERALGSKLGVSRGAERGHAPCHRPLRRRWPSLRFRGLTGASRDAMSDRSVGR